MLSILNIGAICFVAGVYVCDFFGAKSTAEVIAAAALFACVLLLGFRKNKSRIFFALLFFSLGALGLFVCEDKTKNPFFPLEEKYVTVEGYISELPVQNGANFSYALKTTSAEYLGESCKAGQTIRITSDKLLRYGDRVTVRGFLHEIPDRKNSTDFDVKRYYQSRAVFYRMYASELFLKDSRENKLSLSYLSGLLKSRIAREIDHSFSSASSEHAAVIKAVLLGNKHFFSEDFRAVLVNSGLIKLFYPSYFHVYLISAACGLCLSGVKKSHRSYIIVFLLLVYAAAGGTSPVLIRNVIAAAVGIFMTKKLGFSHYPDIASITVLILCGINPLLCFDVGVVMSTASGLLFYYFADILNSVLFFIKPRAARRFLTFYIITTFGLLPIASLYFNGLSLWTALLTPLYLVIVAGLLILVPAALLLRAATGSMLLLDGAISALCLYFEEVPYLILKLPLSHVFISPHGGVFLAAVYSSLAFIRRIYTGDLKTKRSGIYAAASSGLWCSVIFVYLISRGQLYVTFVNVGQGDGAVISVRGGETVLIDGGGRTEFSDYNAGDKVFFPYLADNGYFDIDKAIVSHYHSDHCLGIISAIENLRVREVLMPSYGTDNPYRIMLERAAEKNGTLVKYVSAKDSFVLKSGLRIDILSPGDEELSSDDENAASIVARVGFSGVNILFTGDIGISQERSLLGSVGKCEVVKLSHHGSAGSNCAEFAEELSAGYAIATVGEDNPYDFPSETAVQNFQRVGTKVLRTDKNGNITVKIDKKGRFGIYRGA